MNTNYQLDNSVIFILLYITVGLNQKSQDYSIY